MVVIIFGVSATGKTTVGRLLAGKMGWLFCDGDDFHSPANLAKMKHGLPLNDRDRAPWLEKLRGLVLDKIRAGQNMVLACSALKTSYRKSLRAAPAVRFVFLKGSYDLISDRTERRRDHFMKASLLRSQFDDLEEPAADESVLELDPRQEPAELVRQIQVWLERGDERS